MDGRLNGAIGIDDLGATIADYTDNISSAACRWTRDVFERSTSAADLHLSLQIGDGGLRGTVTGSWQQRHDSCQTDNAQPIHRRPRRLIMHAINRKNTSCMMTPIQQR